MAAETLDTTTLDTTTLDTTMTSLIVQRCEPAALGIQLFELARPDGGHLPEFTPGAHVALQVPLHLTSGGELRKYSLCNDPDERATYQLAVKRETPDLGGRGGSASLIDGVKTGDTLLVSLPRNDFELKPSPAGYTFIAGGIGITPLLSMTRHLKATGAGKFRLYYLTRSKEATPFLAELMGPKYRGLVTIHHDEGDPDKAFDLWPALEKPKGHIYCCGPRGLMTAVRDMTGHWSSTAVHFEAFQDVAKQAASDVPFKVTVKGHRTPVDVPAGCSILDALRANGFTVPSSCESGTCGSCKTRLIAGDVEHRDLVLSEADKARHIMVCVSRARTGDLEIELPA